MFKQLALPIPAMLMVSDCGLVVSLVDRIKVFDTPVVLKEVYHISDIREVSLAQLMMWWRSALGVKWCLQPLTLILYTLSYFTGIEILQGWNL